jgi:hypothetical protein
MKKPKLTVVPRDLDQWDAEIEAEFQRVVAATKKARRKKVEPFAMVPLWWIAAAAKATRSPRTMVLIELLYASWKAKSLTFPLPNSRLAKLGASRETKREVLLDLERAGLISVVRPPRKTPLVTLTSL